MTKVFAAIKSRPYWVNDILVAITAFAAATFLSDLDMEYSYSVLGQDVPETSEYVLHKAIIIAATLPLATRRRLPIGSAVAALAATALAMHLLIPAGAVYIAIVFLMIIAVGRYGQAKWRTPIRILLITAFEAPSAYAAFTDQVIELEGFEEVPIVLSIVVGLSLSALLHISAWTVGDSGRKRHQKELALLERTKELEEERELNAQRAVLDERVRIARELHDVVAHHVSVMGVQASAARRLLDDDPARAKHALGTIEGSSRNAVTELGRILGFLRYPNETNPKPDSQASLNKLPELLNQIKQAGLNVTQNIQGQPHPLPTSVDLSAFRIIQEGLTNVIKHAHTNQAHLKLHYQNQQLEIQIQNPGPTHINLTTNPNAPTKPAGPGHGLLGIKERVALNGGSVRCGPLNNGGYYLEAKLPYNLPAEPMNKPNTRKAAQTTS